MSLTQQEAVASFHIPTEKIESQTQRTDPLFGSNPIQKVNQENDPKKGNKPRKRHGLQDSNARLRIQLYNAGGEKWRDHWLTDPKNWQNIASIRLGRIPNHSPYKKWSAGEITNLLKESRLLASSRTGDAKKCDGRQNAIVTVYSYPGGQWARVDAVGDKSTDLPYTVCYLASDSHAIPTTGLRKVSVRVMPRVSVKRPRLDENPPRPKNPKMTTKQPGVGQMQMYSQSQCQPNPSHPALYNNPAVGQCSWEHSTHSQMPHFGGIYFPQHTMQLTGNSSATAYVAPSGRTQMRSFPEWCGGDYNHGEEICKKKVIFQ